MVNGRALKAARMLAGLTIEQAAQQAGIGRMTVSRAENGHPLTVKSLDALARLYKRPIADFFLSEVN